MKALLAIAIMLLPGMAWAQNTVMMPNGIGGYNVFTPGHPTTSIMPNGIGGYNTLTPGQPSTSINPNGIGGYNIFSPQPLPNAFDDD